MLLILERNTSEEKGRICLSSTKNLFIILFCLYLSFLCSNWSIWRDYNSYIFIYIFIYLHTVRCIYRSICRYISGSEELLFKNSFKKYCVQCEMAELLWFQEIKRNLAINLWLSTEVACTSIVNIWIRFCSSLKWLWFLYPHGFFPNNFLVDVSTRFSSHD